MVRTRFAPSPTGYLHIGGVRTALFNWLFARQHGGQFILRVDDTDAQRNDEATLRPILEGFRWLGLDWDEGPEVGGPHAPYFQSARRHRYQAAVDQLLAGGHAYWDFARPDEIAAEREEAQRQQGGFRYSRRWMAETDADRERFEREGRQGVVRLRMPTSGLLTLHDHVRGDVTFDWSREQDHVIQRHDGSVLYHLATVVDDHDFDITHVIRAEEHLSNTPRQVFIAQSLGYATPQFAHIPFVAEPGSKTKISKRKLQKYLKHREFAQLVERGTEVMSRLGQSPDAETFNPVMVDFYRQVGFLPHALINYFLLLGWSLDGSTEFFTRDEMLAHFSLERINHAPASFDPAKLIAFQEHYMRQEPLERRVEHVLPFAQLAGWMPATPDEPQRQKLSQIVDAAGDRLVIGGDITSFDEFFQEDQSLTYDGKALSKRLGTEEARERLRAVRDVLAGADCFDAAVLEQLIRQYIANAGIKMGDVIHAVRIAVTGKAIGAGMFETLAILGRESTLRRIDHTLEQTG